VDGLSNRENLGCHVSKLGRATFDRTCCLTRSQRLNSKNTHARWSHDTQTDRVTANGDHRDSNEAANHQ
jgi:hypothetical protein